MNDSTTPSRDPRQTIRIVADLGPAKETPTEAAYAEAERGLRAWSKGSYDAEAVTDLITKTHLVEYVVPKYLDWDDERTMARPKLRELLRDVATGATYMSSSAELLAQLAFNMWRGPDSAAKLDLRGLWNLDPTNRRVVIETLCTALKVER